MNKTQVIDLVKSIGSIAGTYIIAKGWLTSGVWADVLQILLLLVSIGFGLKTTATPALMRTLVSTPEVQAQPELARKLQAQVAPAKFWMG